MQSNSILMERRKLILWVFPLYFPQVTNEHIKCNDWSLVHLVTNCARAYMAIYMHVCVLIYKKGVDYLAM